MRPDELIILAEELLDAHLDTVELCEGLSVGPNLEVHLEYLRALQRRGHELLAASEIEPASR